jgi:CheY-like chemotaxis protein
MRIVLIDDDEQVRAVLTRALEREGHAVLALSDAVRLTATLDRFEADVVFTDVYMPEVDGFQALRVVRSERPHIPVVVFSGGASPTDNCLSIATMLGAAAILHKPVTISALLETLRSVAAPAAARADRADSLA